MKTTIGVYDSHKKAVQAILKLKDSGYHINKLSLLGQAEIIDDHLRVRSSEQLPLAEVSIGVATGSILGILTGVGVFAIPGLGFLYGAGALVGAFAGFDFGLIGGGITSILTTLGMKHEHALKYEEHLKEGKFMIVAQGEKEDVEKARQILNEHSTHLALESH